MSILKSDKYLQLNPDGGNELIKIGNTLILKNINIPLNIVLFNLDFLCIVLSVHFDWFQ